MILGVVQERWAEGLMIGLGAGAIIAAMQLLIAYRYIDPRLKKITRQKQVEVWSAARLEFYARCLLTSWSMTHGLPNYLIVRNGHLHMRQGIEWALDDIVQKSTSFDLAVGLTAKGLSDSAIANISMIADALSSAAADAATAKSLLEKLAPALPHIDTVPQSVLDDYVICPFGHRNAPREHFERLRFQAAYGIAATIEHILEAARELREFADTNAKEEKICIDKSQRYRRLISRFGDSITVENDMATIDVGFSALQHDLGFIKERGLCFVMVDEAEDGAPRVGSAA